LDYPLRGAKLRDCWHHPKGYLGFSEEFISDVAAFFRCAEHGLEAVVSKLVSALSLGMSPLPNRQSAPWQVPRPRFRVLRSFFRGVDLARHIYEGSFIRLWHVEAINEGVALRIGSLDDTAAHGEQR
jgi:hypothetical protein